MTAADFAEFIAQARHCPNGEWEGQCPAHEDTRPSLTWKDGDKGLVLNCHRGCSYEAVCRAAKVPVAALFHDRPAVGRTDDPILATYDYVDEHGTLLFQVVRTALKHFWQRRPATGGGWTNGLGDARRVLYHLDRLQGQPVVAVVEGEKDVDRLDALGIPATTNPMGAGKWTAAYTKQLRDAGAQTVRVFRDNDAAGVAHADQVAQSCATAGLIVQRVLLPDLPPVRPKSGEDVSDWLATHSAEALHAAIAAAAGVEDEPEGDRQTSTVEDDDYLEDIDAFLTEPDPPALMLVPELVPAGVIVLVHGEARARKSLAAFELALSLATGTAAFGLARFTPARAEPVIYVQEEDPRDLTRPRLRRLVQERRRHAALPAGRLTVSIRRGVNLDDPAWIDLLIESLRRRQAKLLVLDAARRLSALTDEGPTKVRALMAALRTIVTQAGVSILIVHHDIKPPQNGQDQRRRGHRASGGDWFAAAECPVSIERINERESVVLPQDFKFSADPVPFEFTCRMSGPLIAALVGRDSTAEAAETAGQRGRLLGWLKQQPAGATKTAMKKAGFGWETVTHAPGDAGEGGQG